MAEGNLVLRLLQANPLVPGANDQFANRFHVSGSTNAVVGDNTQATREPGEPDHAGNDGGRSLWWSWIAPRSAPVRFDTVESDFDTILAVYQGSRVDALSLVAADERSAGGGRSVVTFQAVEGVEYQVAVDGFNDGDEAASGRAVLRVRQYDPGALHANDDFEHAPPISDSFPTVLGSNIGATRQAGEPAHGQVSEGRSVWWTWVASADGPVTVSTAQSQFDTLLAVYTGNLLNSLELVAENDDIDPGTLQSRVTFQATAGTEYRLAVDGYGQQIGVIVLSVVPSRNVALAPRIQQNPVSQTRFAGGTGGGSQIRLSVVASGAPPLAYQWFRNGLPVAGATSAQLDLDGANPDEAGRYQVTITNAFGVVTSEEAALTVMDVPFNNDFARRLAIPGSSAVVRGSLLGADKEPNEPHHGSEVGGRSVWWRWTAVTNGLMEVHTFGSSVDTLLGVYTGRTVEGLTRVAENDDLLMDQVYASRVRFQAIAGVEYQIAVDAPKTNQAAGNVVLTLGSPAAPVIVLQPQPVSLVEVTNATFALQVSTLGGASADRYQWNVNGVAIPGATNETYALGALSSAASGVYSVAVTNDFGGVVSSNAVVLVRMPPQLTVDRLEPDGRLRLRFGEPNATVASDPRFFAIQQGRRFEVQSTSDLGNPAAQWNTSPGEITFDAGRFWFEESAPESAAQHFYRVVELPESEP